MAAPLVEASTSSQEGSDATSHTVSFPTGIVSGDLLVCLFATDSGDPASSFPSGWTRFKNLVESAGACSLEAWWKEADGTESGSFTVTTTNSEESAHAVYRISGAALEAPEVSTGTEGNSQTADADSLTPSGGSDDYLWVAATGGDRVGLAASAPTNYSNFHTEATGGIPACSIAAATRQLTAPSEDPGAFGDWQASDEWVAFTVAVAPPATPSGPQTVVVGQAIETDTAQVLGRLKEKAIGQALETATAQAVTRVKARTIGQATETALAQALGRVKEKLIGQAAETDTAQAVSAAGKQVIAVGQAVETDIAQALAFAKAKAIGLATETDTAQALTVVRPVLIGQALETNTAQPVDYFKTVRLGQAVETDTALTVTVVGGLVVVHGAPGPLRVEVDPYSTEIDLDPSLTAVDLDPSITHVAVDRDRTTT